MGQQQSKTIQPPLIKTPKADLPPITTSLPNICSPKLKVNFNYIDPLKHDMEEIPDDLHTHFQQSSLHSSTSSSSIENTSTIYSLSHIEEINVKWNYFAKMKHRYYLTDYELIKKVGKGGFGVVNKVRSLHTKVLRAAKIIKKKQLNQAQHKKILQELSIMRVLDHPNIIKVYEVYDFQDEYTFILQLMSGGQLDRKVRGKRIPQKLARTYMKQLIRTLIYLHSQGIVHRDLKPENMMFQNQEAEVIKIIDFGIATRLQPGEFMSDRMGTLSFIAPEVIYKRYNQKCDIWSAGVIFYNMLTGTMPFKSDNDNKLLQAILREQPRLSGPMFERYSVECMQVLKLMFQKKPQRRPSAVQIYSHRWFSMQQQHTPILPQLKGQILSNIRQFNFSNKLQAVVHTFIASQLLTTEEKFILVETFKQLDVNNDGVITAEELRVGLERGGRISGRRLECLVRVVDTNRSGLIEYTEFLVAGLTNQQILKRQHFQRAFSYFDTDHSGRISYSQVVQFLQSFQQSQQQIQRMFNSVDSNGDGEIDKEEFIKLFVTRTAHMKLLHCWGGMDALKSTNQQQQQQQQQLGVQFRERKRLLLAQFDLTTLALEDGRYSR